jgi:hypothetical protein
METVDRRIEEKNLWWAFHRHLVVELFTWLREHLDDVYLVDIQSRTLPGPRSPRGARPAHYKMKVVGLESAAKPALPQTDQAWPAKEQLSIQIRRRDRQDVDDPFACQVVSVVETVSPADKGLAGTAKRQSFVRSRRKYLASAVSYTEVDLLQEGARDLALPVEQLATYPFMVWSSQVQVDARHHWGWGWGIDEALPSITLPLDHPHLHVLDLALCYEQCYVVNRWDKRLEQSAAAQKRLQS